MIELLLPAEVRSAHAYDDPAGVPLLPGEPELIASAVPKRRAEFTTVRHCARTALAALGQPPVPLLRGDRGAPIWPPGIVGSMTHCPGYRAAAVARSAEVPGIGIDAEEHGPLPEGVLAMITSAEERAHLEQLADDHPGVWWQRLLFSAKESVYKVWFPRTGEWLGFEQAALTFSPAAPAAADPAAADAPTSGAGPGAGASGTFRARILRDGPFASLDGRFLVRDGLVLTAITLPAG